MSEQISQSLSRVAPSATMAVVQKGREMRAAGIDVINLGAGEPDFDTPEHIKEAAVRALAEGKTKYTNVDGIPELKEAIIGKFKRDNNLSYNTSQINVSPGGKPVLYNAFVATLNPGDEVIIPTPCWVSYPEMVKLASGTPKLVNCDMSSGFKITPGQLEGAITSRTKWLALNSPSNPTGATYTKAELRALGAVLKQHPHVMILTDDIYEHLVYNGLEYATIAQACPELYERTLTMNGVSKAYAMTGWRIGYAGGPEWLIKAMAKVMGQTTSNPSSISQWAAVEALNGDQTFLKEWNKIFQDRRDHVVAGLNQTGSLSCLSPDGAFYAYPDCSDVIGKQTPAGKVLQTDTDFAMAIMSEAHVAVVPGTAFHGAPHIRLSFASDTPLLIEACSRIQAFCEKLS